MRLECKYRTRQDGSLYTESKYPQVVEELYNVRKLIMRMPNTLKREYLIAFAAAIEDKLFSEGEESFEDWLKMNRQKLLDSLDVFFAEALNGVLTWGIKGRLEKIIS